MYFVVNQGAGGIGCSDICCRVRACTHAFWCGNDSSRRVHASTHPTDLSIITIKNHRALYGSGFMLTETPKMMPVVNICTDSNALAVRAADLVIQTSREAIAQRGRFTFALSGGSTPEKTYTLLAEAGRASAIDWSHTYLFFGDERFVPAEDPRSNVGMVRRNLLSRIPVPSSNVFPISTQAPNAAVAAEEYAKKLAEYFSISERTIPPRFDLIFLGLGSDGHTASLFPFTDALDVTDAWATWTSPGTSPPPVKRVTLTYPVLNAARQVVFLVSGKNKAVALRDILEGQAPREDRPAAGVQLVDGAVTWLVDKEAARLLTQQY
jgi:6-phosphogluconolactonase